jgi:dihydroneopterin aldolase
MDADTMQQLTVDITDIIKENQEEVRKKIQEQVADAVAKGFQDLSSHMLEIEKEDKIMCVQCDEVGLNFKRC